MQRVCTSLSASLNKLCLSDTELFHKFTEEVIDNLLKLVVDRCVLKLVLLLIVKDQTILVQERHYGGLPPRTSQEVDNDIEEPILKRSDENRISYVV